MALDTKTPKGYRKAWNGGQKPVIGLDLIAEEQARQVTRYSPEHDDAHDRGELRDAASCYLAAAMVASAGSSWRGRPSPVWPWEPGAWKPSDDPIRNLQKAGALIASEIDRLLRKQAQERSHQS